MKIRTIIMTLILIAIVIWWLWFSWLTGWGTVFWMGLLIGTGIAFWLWLIFEGMKESQK